ncbi:MAG TPA: hypothetical protein VH186_18010 [Chloroflexia bacterium]|nr:hypothetical protein [Chloroflexia bacterium]
MTGSGVGWWFMIIGIATAFIPFLIVSRKRWWPGAWGWAIDFIAISLAVSDNFHSWTPVSIAGLIVGTTLGFTGILTGPNSPAA